MRDVEDNRDILAECGRFMGCLYFSGFSEFCAEDVYSILGKLHASYNGDVNNNQNMAWSSEIKILKNILSPYKNDDGRIIFEYDIPRLGKRIDVVLLFKGIIFCLEFKVGESQINEMDVDQVLDYALDLKNFHLFSRDKIIVPILIATRYQMSTSRIQMSCYDDGVVNPLFCGENSLSDLIREVLSAFNSECEIDERWVNSPYAPTPTIIEAARTLYEHHSVDNITRHEADGAATDKTIGKILNIIKRSRERNERSICFVTGVPGAGKTLVGLDVAIKQTYQDDGKARINADGAVYLSGNGPLVAVLTEALAQDDKKRSEKKNLSDSRREVSAFIQMIHRYRDSMLKKLKTTVSEDNKIVLPDGRLEIDPEKAVENGEAGFAEVENVAIFDEAQRAWTYERLAAYLKRGGHMETRQKSIISLYLKQLF